MADRSWLTDELLVDARALAALAHERPETAEAAVAHAKSMLDTNTDTAEKTIQDRIRNQRTPTSMVLLGPPLFQRLVYLASDQLAHAEGEAEACTQTADRLLARYLQFILAHVLDRSSRWVAVAFAQLVYGYGGAELDEMIVRVSGKFWDERA